MRILVFSFFFSIFTAFGQDEKRLFAQGLFQIENEQNMFHVQNTIKELPNVYMVRMEFSSQRFFIVTKDLQELSEETLANWFGQYAQTVRCVQIGIHGQDKVNAFPFECSNH